MLRTTKAALLAVAISILALAVGAESEPTPFDIKRSAESGATVKARIEQIIAEAAALTAAGPHWAGQYYHGDGLGVNVSLTIAPEAGFAFEWHGCMGVYDRNWGNVSVEPDGALALTFTLPNEQQGFQGLASRFIPVRWGERFYLIPADDMIGFCNRVNQGFEPRNAAHGMHLLRSEDWTRPAPGQPEIPAEFSPYLLDAPIEATLVSADSPTTRPGLGEITFRDTPITLDAGRSHGVMPGMVFYTTDQMYFYNAKVTAVEDATCRAIVTQSWGPNFRPEFNPPPAPGHRFSTTPAFSPRNRKQ